MGYYRFLDNEQVSVSELVRSLSSHCQTQVQERHGLAISDTSEINLQSHSGRIDREELGVLGLGNLADCLLRRMVWATKPMTTRNQDAIQRTAKV
jgi:hypothetical protein